MCSMLNPIRISSAVPAQVMAAPRTAASAFLSTLADAGVELAFGVPGGTVSPLFAALEPAGIRLISTRHEATSAFAAMGAARLTGRPALVLTTSGPGLTNALTGIAAAHYEGVPLIVVAGDVPTRALGRNALQDGSSDGLGVAAMVNNITRWHGALRRADAAPGVAARAYRLARGPRPGPVVVTAPLDVSAAPVELAPHFWFPEDAPLRDLNGAARASAVLTDVRLPLLVLGNGARNATAEAVSLAERLNMGVLVTGHGKGAFPERHPQFQGIIGLGQHPSVARFLQDRPDVTVIVGSRMNDLATNGWSLPLTGTRATIQIDADPGAIGVNLPVTHAVVADAAAGVRDLLTSLPHDAVRPSRKFAPVVRARVAAEASEATPITPQRLLRGLERRVPDALWVSDIGEHLSHALHTLEVRAGRFHDFLGFGSMGSGICAALGMKLVAPDEPVVCVCGDGGFASYAGEVLTAVENRLGIVYVVFNDGCWNMVEHGFRAVYGRAPGGLVRNVADLASVAEGMGARGIVIRSPRELDALPMAELATSSRPTVLDVRIDARESLTASTRSAALKHFSGGAR